MREELTKEETKELEITDFLRELVCIISQKFDNQKNQIAELQRNMNNMKENDVIEMKASINEIMERLSEMNIRLDDLSEKEKKISRDILGAIID